jgi:hypothetical protein
MMKRTKDKTKAKLFKQWVIYLRDGRLTEAEIIKRAKSFTKKGMVPSE